MGDEPRNAASEFTRRWAAWLSDRDFVAREITTLITPDFVRYDRRRLVAVPPAGATAWVDELFEIAEPTEQWPTYELIEIVAVRGDRACASRWVIRFGDRAEAHVVMVSIFEEKLQRLQRHYIFDPEDIEVAIEELDRLHVEFEANG